MSQERKASVRLVAGATYDAGRGIAIEWCAGPAVREPSTRTVVALVAIILASCATAARSSSRAEVEAVVAGIVAAVNAADVDAFMSFFAPEADAFLPSAASPSRLTGHAQIRAGIAPALAAKPIHSMAVRDLVITIDGATAIASFEIGKPIVHSRRTLVLKRTGGKWRVVHLHGSNLREEAR
jgi:ketosteroid isomerase-like protein